MMSVTVFRVEQPLQSVIAKLAAAVLNLVLTNFSTLL